MVDELAHYKVYVVRCWEEQRPQTDTTVLRFTLEIPSTGQRFGFKNQAALMKALENRLSPNSVYIE